MIRTLSSSLRWFVQHLPGGHWLWAWTDPHHISHSLLRQAIKERAYALQGRILDLGCGKQPYRDLFSHVQSYVGVDLPGNAIVSAYASALAMPFRNASFDAVLCNEVIEHVPEPSAVFAEISRILKPGGILLLTTPQTWGLHLEPYDFYRYTPYGLTYLATKHRLVVTEAIATSGLWATFAQRVVDTIVFNYMAAQPYWLLRLASMLLIPVLVVGVVMDKLFGKRGDTLDNVLLAQKPSE